MAAVEPFAAFSKGRDGIYRCNALSECAWLDHGFTTRHSPGPAHPVTTLRQVHSAGVWNASGLDDRAEEGDALVSNEVGRCVGVRTADCVPILLADPIARSFAAIHAGWRGTALRIATHTVERLSRDFDTRPENILAAIGPAIGICCYQVGADVCEKFRGLFPEWEQGDRASGGMLDLVEANRRILEQAGIPPQQIYVAGLCTRDREDEFFSYRREPQEPGRMVSFIGRLG